MTIALLLFIIPFSGYSTNFHSLDSLGLTEKQGKKYIIHEVEAGETLFALSRLYNVSVKEIRDANESSVSDLNIGQKVLIPFVEKAIDKNATVHVVNSSETLFSISRNYNVKVDELKAWNNLTENSISIGQKLIIKKTGTTTVSEEPVKINAVGRKTHKVEESQTLYSISRMYDVSTDELKAWNQLSSNNLDIGQVLIVSDNVERVEPRSNSSMLPASENQASSLKKEEEITKPKENNIPAKVTVAVNATPDINTDLEKVEPPAEKVVQRGIAEVYEESGNTKKYLALHRDAPVGTIMQVKNEMNNQTVFVRVVGQIPPTGDNAKLLLKISKKAYDRLGAVDSRFPVEISYIP